jgi:hypothetical protein
VHRSTTTAASTASVMAALTVRRSTAAVQGLTLVHFLAQHKRYLWDRGCT